MKITRNDQESMCLALEKYLRKTCKESWKNWETEKLCGGKKLAKTEKWTFLVVNKVHHLFKKRLKIAETRSKTEISEDDKKKEYLTIDVTAYPEASHPLIAVCEAETCREIEKIEYCLWKLLSVKAQFRLLVAYYSGKVNGSEDVKTAEDLAKMLCKKVAKHFKPDNNVWLLLADWNNAKEYSGTLYYISGDNCFRPIPR